VLGRARTRARTRANARDSVPAMVYPAAQMALRAAIRMALAVVAGGCTATKGAAPAQEGGAADAGPSTSAATLAPAAPSTGSSAMASVEAGSGPGDVAPGASLSFVVVENIGLHIGGGPNDPATKAPIARSVAPYFDRLRACWSVVEDPGRGGTFGLDLLVPADGGRATVSHPRTRLGPNAFRDCVTRVFEDVEFAKPLGGRTTVSYSLRFEPKQGDARFAP
jgi:hypothetical protein